MVSAARISWAMTGQSVVQTGSRKVSSTTLPRRLASDTWRTSWLVSVKFGAGVSSAPDDSVRAWAMTGSALWLTDANAIGAAPTKMTPNAPNAATDRPLSAANPSRQAAIRDGTGVAGGASAG